MPTFRIAVLGGLFLSACGTDPEVTCTSIEAVQVTAGLTPTITWSPSCGVNRVVVHVALPATKPPANPGDGVIVGSLMWEVHASAADANTLSPPVRYGQIPPGAVLAGGPEALVSSTEYVIIVSTRDPEQFESPFGYLEFTP